MFKRGFDVSIAVVLGVIAAPLVIGCAVILAIQYRSWPFFTQDRVGADGRVFRFVKLRTLPPSTPHYLDKYALQDIDASAFGRWLRKLHIDELPQLYLVPLGRLSLVGPRAEMPCLHEQMPASFAEFRTSVRPGCTGLWQVGTDAGRLIFENPEYDCFYVQHANMRLDLWILWRTALLFFGVGDGITVSDVPRWALRREPVAKLPPELVTEAA